MNPRLHQLAPYPFQRLNALLEDLTPGLEPVVDLSLGEPRHPAPETAWKILSQGVEGASRYPRTQGIPALRESAARWLERRYGLPPGAVDPDTQVLPTCGSREALSAIALACVGSEKGGSPPVVLVPNPFYAIYEGAARLAGAEVWYVPCPEEGGFLPALDRVPPSVLERTVLCYLCTPANPTGAVAPRDYLEGLIHLAQEYGFVIASDECYSEIYPKAPPPGLLEVAWGMGNRSFQNCLVFQSLSKRSSLPGIRSGFVAGDATILSDYLRLRIYLGATSPLFVQEAAAWAWSDEAHVVDSRLQYQEKIRRVCEILSPVLPVRPPEGGFFLWIRVGDGEVFARELYRHQGVRVLPGAYLARTVGGSNPGAPYVRLALVGTLEECEAAALRMAQWLGADPV